jgi:hypothetical protein
MNPSCLPIPPQARHPATDKPNMPNFDLVKHRPSSFAPVLFICVILAAAFSQWIGNHLMPALILLIGTR